MKTLTVFSFLLFVSLNQSPGQSAYRPVLQKGSIVGNGSMSLSFGKTTVDFTSQYLSSESKETYSSINLSPKIGILIVNGLMIGLAADFNSITTEHEEEPLKMTTKQYLIGPALRYYAPGGFFVHADIGFGKNVDKYDGETNDARLMKWQAGMGYAFFVQENIAIEPGLSYRKSSSKRESDFGNMEGSLGEFVVGVGFTLFLHKGL